MATVKLNIEVTKDKSGAITATIKDLQNLENQSKKTGTSLDKMVKKTLSDLAGKAGISSEALASIGTGAGIAAAGLGVLTAAGAGVAALTASFVAHSDALGEMSDKYGIAASELGALEKALAPTGVSVDQFAASISKMEQNLGGSSTAFKRLGLDAKALKSMLPVDATKTILDQISRLSTESERMAAVTDIFGKSGRDAWQAYKQGAFEGLDAARAMEAELGDSRAKAAALADKMAELNVKWAHFKELVGANVGVPLLEGMLATIDKLNETGFNPSGWMFSDKKNGALPGGTFGAPGVQGAMDAIYGNKPFSLLRDTSAKPYLSDADIEAANKAKEALKKLFDEIHVWAYTTSDKDAKWIKSIIAEKAAQNVQAGLDILNTFSIPTTGNRFTTLLGNQLGGKGSIDAAKQKADAEKMAKVTQGLTLAFQGLTSLAEAVGGAFGTILKSGVGGAQAGLGIGNTIGTIFKGVASFAGPIGAAVGGVVGIISGIFAAHKKKAEELKKKQAAAIDAFKGLYEQWTQARKDLAATGLAGITAIIENGTAEQLAHAGEYLAATFEMLRKSGMSVADALRAVQPLFEKLAEKGITAAGPLADMANVANANKEVLALIDGLGLTANALAGFGLFTQDIANQMSTDLGAAIQGLINSGVDASIALALNAQALYNLDQAAQRSGVTLDEHTQKMIDDAKAAGLFVDLEDPMKALVDATQAMVVAMAEMVKLLGGAVPEAIQKMIDTFNNAHINTGGGGDGSTSTGTTPPPAPEPPHMAAGGLVTRPTYALIGESGPELVVPVGRGSSSTMANGGAGLSFNYTPTFQINGSGLSRRELVAAINEINRSNEGAAVTRMKQALASR